MIDPTTAKAQRHYARVCIADRRVPNFNEDRQIAMKELYAAAKEHADANQ